MTQLVQITTSNQGKTEQPTETLNWSQKQFMLYTQLFLTE